MRYLVEQIWVWLAAALILGLMVGSISRRQARGADDGRPNWWLRSYVVLALAGVGVVYAEWIRGAAGLWFEILVMLGVAYLAGCVVGSLTASRAERTAVSDEPDQTH